MLITEGEIIGVINDCFDIILERENIIMTLMTIFPFNLSKIF